MKDVASILLLLSFCPRVCDFGVYIHGPDGESVSVMEGDSVTLHTGVKTNQRDRRNWYRLVIDLSKLSEEQCCFLRFRPITHSKIKQMLEPTPASRTIGREKIVIDFSKLIEEPCFFLWIPHSKITEMLEPIPASRTTDREKTWGRFPVHHMYVQCEERFRDRLKLDHQTGSLIIRDSRTTDSGDYYLKDCSSMFNIKHFSVSVHGVSAAVQDQMKRKSVNEGEPVILYTGVIKDTIDLMKWYFNDTLIAEITGDQSKSCEDVQCEERFRDRLKLDHQTGSLIITNTRTDHTGDYKLQISSSRFSIIRSFSVSVTGFFGIGSDGVSVFMMEGDSVTLHTGVKRVQREIIRWHFNDSRIAQIHGRKCTGFKCRPWFKERFRDSLNLDHKTGSLTIKNIRTSGAGVYGLRIISTSGRIRVIKNFSVSVHGVSAAVQDQMKRKSLKEEESVTLYPGVIKKPNHFMKWYFNDTLIAGITGDQSQICTDVQCEERFRDRLKLDHQTGSLTITHTRNTDSGVYKLKISNSRISIIKRFSVTVTGESNPYKFISFFSES